MAPFLGSATQVALPTIAREYDLSGVMQAWFQTAYMLGAAMLLLPVGRMADIVGRKRVFTIGIVGTAVVAILTTMAPSPLVLIVMRLLHGMTNALIFGTSAAMVTSVYQRGERGMALGLTIASVYFGLTCGPALGGFLTDHLGWRSIFYAIIPLALIIILTVLIFLKDEWAEARGKRFDWPGTTLYCLGLGLLVLGGARLKTDTSMGITMLTVGLLFVAGFLVWETYLSSSPLLNVRLFRGNRIFVMSNLAAFLNYAALSTILFFLSLYMQDITGRTAFQAGLVMLTQPLLMAVFSPITGRLSDRIEPRRLSSAGLLIMAAGMSVLALLRVDSPVLQIYVGLAIIGFGMALFSSPNVNAIMSSVGQRYQGVASAMMGTMRTTGNLAAMTCATLLMSVLLGQLKPTEAPDGFMRAMTIAFSISVVISITAAAVSLTRGRLHHDSQDEA